jgi:phosphoglycerol geranylgeranyltransferase
MQKTWDRLRADADRQGAALWQLLDPERISPDRAAEIARTASDVGCDAFLIGTSIGSPARFAAVAQAVKRAVHKPVLIFPNGAAQVVPYADAILFMSLLSGRNPEYLIGEQVKGAPLVDEYNLEAIPTAYLLIESGRTTAVEFVSDTRPIPRDKIDIAYAHCLAAKYFGMQLVYLEAGSGAPETVPIDMIKMCAQSELCLAVGGGIREPRRASDVADAGASFVVIGTRFEPEPDWELYREFVDAVHTKARVQT